MKLLWLSNTVSRVPANSGKLLGGSCYYPNPNLTVAERPEQQHQQQEKRKHQLKKWQHQLQKLEKRKHQPKKRRHQLQKRGLQKRRQQVVPNKYRELQCYS